MARVSALRAVLRGYASLRMLRSNAQPELILTFRGSHRGSTLARYLEALYSASPPNIVLAGLSRRNWAQRGSGPPYRIRGSRPVLRLYYVGARLWHLLEAVGWRTGSARIDAKLRAWRRWIAYRDASARLRGGRARA